MMDVSLSGVRSATDRGGLFLPCRDGLGGVDDTGRVQPLIPEVFY